YSRKRFLRVQCVKRRKHQMAGFRGKQCRFYGFEVAHFADENHVRILTERTAKRFGERTRINIDLALRYERFFIFVKEFDRVLDRYDMAISIGIYLVHDRGKRRRFARTGRAGKQYQPPIFLCDGAEYRW